MPLKYILIIVGASLFFLLFVVYIVLAVRRRKKEDLQNEEIEKMYSGNDVATMDYDCAVYDEETEKILKAKQVPNGQLTIDEFMKISADENVFQTVEKEGLEEITGNYKPE